MEPQTPDEREERRPAPDPAGTAPLPEMGRVEAIRSQLVNGAIVATAVFGVPALLASISRVREVGWHPIMFFHIFCLLTAILLSALRNRLSFRTRSVFLVGLFFLLGCGSLYTWGLLAWGFPWLIFCSVFATLFYGTRTGLKVTAASLCAALAAFAGVRLGLIRFDFDIAAVALAATSWSTAIILFGMFTAITVLIMGRLHAWLIRSNQELTRRSADLARSNEALDRENRHRREAEVMLRRYERMVAASGDLMVLLDRDRVCKAVNPAYLHAQQTRPEDMVGRPLPELPGEEGGQGKSAACLAACLEGREMQEHAWFRFPGLGRRFMSLTCYPIRGDGGDVSGLVLSLRDTTRARQMEQELRQTHKLEAVGSLAGGIAHDFNNLLTRIVAHTELTLLNHPEDPDLQNTLGHVIRAAGHGKRLVKQILVFSRQAEPETAPVDLKRVLEEGIRFLRSSLPATIRIRQRVETESRVVLCDPTQVHQILVNLFSNAAHAMGEHGGRIDVLLRDAPADAPGSPLWPELKPGPFLELAVSDTGHGMDRETQERIFEPFFTTKDRDQGTGMGLAVVHGIVQSLGGAVRVESAPGRGTTFRLLLPKTGQEPAREPRREAPLVRGKGRILFVDDDPEIVRAVKRLLARLGYDAVAASCGLEALEAFRARPDAFDLVMTDMTMPGMTGEQLSRELLKIRPGVPILLCTGFSEAMGPDRARAMGIRDLVMKPFSIRELSVTIHRTLSDARAPDPGAP